MSLKIAESIVVKYEEHSDRGIYYTGNGGNLWGGKYDTNPFNALRMSSTEASRVIDKEIEEMLSTIPQPINSIFRIETVYVPTHLANG